jgi:hypothetical protein
MPQRDSSLGSMRCGRLQMGQSAGTMTVSGPTKSSSIALCTCWSVIGHQKTIARLLSRIVAISANSIEHKCVMYRRGSVQKGAQQPEIDISKTKSPRPASDLTEGHRGGRAAGRQARHHPPSKRRPNCKEKPRPDGDRGKLASAMNWTIRKAQRSQ